MSWIAPGEPCSRSLERVAATSDECPGLTPWGSSRFPPRARPFGSRSPAHCPATCAKNRLEVFPRVTGHAPGSLFRALVLLVMTLTVMLPIPPVDAAISARARDYIVARKGHRITPLSPAVALKSPGHDGKVVEWAGRVQGLSTREDGLYLVMVTHGGDSFLIKAQNAGTWSVGKAAYVLGRIVEGAEGLHHVDAIAMALSGEVSAIHVANLQRAAPAMARQDLPFMQIDSRSLSRAAALSVESAVRWIRSFNRSMDASSATDLARAVFYYCARYGVDTRMVLSLIAAESAFNERAVSSAGARGLGQLMPGTAENLGVRNSFDRYQNLEGAVRHMSGLLARWRNSPVQWQLVLASYNAGAGAVEQYRGIPPYPETIQYVRTIFGYYAELRSYE